MRKQRGFWPLSRYWAELIPVSHGMNSMIAADLGAEALEENGHWTGKLCWHVCLLKRAPPIIWADRPEYKRHYVETVAHHCMWWAVGWVEELHVTVGGTACLRLLEQCKALSGRWTKNRRNPCSSLFHHIAMCCWHFDCLLLLIGLASNWDPTIRPVVGSLP